MTDTRSTGGIPESADESPSDDDHRDLLARLQDAERTEGGLDELFDALSSPRRRHVAAYVDEHGRASLEELAEHVAECESPDRPSINSVQLALHHADIPRLVDAGLLAYGDDNHHVERGDRLTAVASLE
ncbi:MAG TPA: hypothetical protein VKM69_10205 [Natronoarchaeum rubrum]|nr:hypothetical protein [Natronoarchaeum rubrum]